MLQVSELLRPGLGPISFIVETGQCIAVTGVSGAGKTLLLRAIADLDPNEGTVSLNKDERRSMPAPQWRGKVGFVPAESGWWADTVGEHFSQRDVAAEIIQELGLPADVLEWQIMRLSTGERHRLALARAMSLEPEVLLLDEPTAALDKQSTRKVEKILRDRLNAGTAIVVVSHDAAQVKRLANAELALENGRAVKLEHVQ